MQKEWGLRFQTSQLSKLRNFFDDCPVTYNNAGVAMYDLVKKGLLANTNKSAGHTGPTPTERQRKSFCETTRAAGHRNHSMHRERALDKH